MTHDDVDTVLGVWARAHDLHVTIASKDAAVRSVTGVGSAGRRAQIWIASAGLAQLLDLAYSTARVWVGSPTSIDP
jgi:hypothetical protein